MNTQILPPSVTPSAFWQLERADSDILLLVCSHLNEPKGRFSFYGTVRGLPVNKLFINSNGNNWYRDGIPGLGGNIEEIAASLRALVDGVAPRELVTFGASMGGYAAILFGALLGATRVLAMSAKPVLPVPGTQPGKLMFGRPLSAYEDLTPYVEAAPATAFHIRAGEADVVDLYSAHRLAHLPNVTVGTVPDGAHEAARALNDVGALVPLIESFVTRRGEIPAEIPAGTALTGDRAAIPWLYLAHMHLEGGQIAAAEEAARRALDHDRGLHIGHALLGRVLVRRGECAAAEPHLRLAVTAAPQIPEYRHHLGLALSGLGRHAEAEEQQRLALSRDSNHPSYHLHLGIALADQGRLEEAVQPMRDAAARNREAPFIQHRLGMVLAELGRHEQAEAAQREAIRISPRNAGFHLQLGHALLAQGRSAEAIAAYEQAVRINPGNPGLQATLERAKGVAAA